MTNKRINNFKKFKKRNPPFHWSLILMIIIVVEFMLLIKERAWSQNYTELIAQMRDQVENVAKENRMIFQRVYYLYNQILSLDEENNYFVKAKRDFSILTKQVSLITNNIRNEE
ncbi:MAG: hypothetical protein NZ866_02395 [Patescibacteria group bacterium]|nr:hypothetical protein [Patescibacteria group bacterium]